jgi:hypothetical protein
MKVASREDTVKKLVLILAMVLAFHGPSGSALSAWAGCKSDCKDQYDSEVDSCKSIHDDPDDSEDLRMCIDSAKDDFDSCIDECENTK